MELDSYADWAARLANTVDPLGREPDQLADLPSLRAFLAPMPRWRRRATAPDVAALREVRDRLRGVFEAPDTATAVRRLNALLASTPVRPQLSSHDGTDWHVHFAAADAPVWQEVTTSAVLGLAARVQQLGADRLGVCGHEACRDVFLDESANRSRRYCSDACSNRANVAAFRARRRLGVVSAAVPTRRARRAAPA